MKKISIILASLIFLAITISCSESFLEKEPPGTTAEPVFYSEKGIDALLLGAYGMISGGFMEWAFSWGASVQNWHYGSVASDDAYKGSSITDQTPVNYIERWEVMPDNGFVHEKWRWVFGYGIYRVNTIIPIINGTELDPGTKARLMGEARFLRAFYNFEAWLVFGNIPIITEDTPDPTQVSNINPEGAILEHIISDLRYAWENLPATQSDKGRPTRYAAMGLAARAYLQALDYESARPLLDNIINSGRYQLNSNFYDNFRIEHNNHPESVFAIQASVNDGACCGANAEMGIGLNFPHGADIGTCCGFHQPSQNLVNAFRVDADGLPVFDQVNVHLKSDMGVASSEEFIPFDDEVDPRLDWTVGRRGIPFLDWGIMRGRDWIRVQENGGPYMPALKTMFNRSDDLVQSTGWMTGVNALNYDYIRYAHILLWRAEVAAFDDDLELARQYVNMIRERADNEYVMGSVQIYELPPVAYPWGPGSSHDDYMTGGDVDWDQPAANYRIGLYPSFANQEKAMQAVQWEQRLEFATEGFRFFDLRRWDNLPAGLNSMPMAETLNEFAQNDIRGFLDGAIFTERDKYQPIPQPQINLQPGVLEQNPGY